jgi:hypothetical protein
MAPEIRKVGRPVFRHSVVRFQARQQLLREVLEPGADHDLNTQNSYKML